jgi:hypothetical protein
MIVRMKLTVSTTVIIKPLRSFFEDVDFTNDRQTNDRDRSR